MSAHWHMFAGYNAWANGRLYAAAAALPDPAYRRDGGAFFGSVHATLNHILVTDRIWMKRFTGAGDAPDRLDAILFDAFDDLRAARVREDARLGAWVEGLADGALNGAVVYRRASEPEMITQPLGEALAHLFNHQTHHRGQAHALITQAAGRAASVALDLAFYQREVRANAAE